MGMYAGGGLFVDVFFWLNECRSGLERGIEELDSSTGIYAE